MAASRIAELPRELRVGCVRYLNSRPLIHGHEASVTFHHPAALADELAAGQLDVGLVPTFELLRQPANYRVVDDVAIACRGRVYSVFLAYCGHLADVRRIWLDPASRTSVNLLRLLLAEFHGFQPDYEPLPPDASTEHPPPAPGEGLLLIGDQAIAFRARQQRNDCRFFDLGEQWQLATGLPFVFAAWLLRSDVPRAPLVADALRAWRQEGGDRWKEVVAAAEATGRYPEGFPEFYLTRCIRYRLGVDEKRAIAEYGRLLHAHGLIDAAPEKLIWL